MAVNLQNRIQKDSPVLLGCWHLITLIQQLWSYSKLCICASNTKYLLVPEICTNSMFKHLFVIYKTAATHPSKRLRIIYRLVIISDVFINYSHKHKHNIIWHQPLYTMSCVVVCLFTKKAITSRPPLTSRWSRLCLPRSHRRPTRSPTMTSREIRWNRVRRRRSHLGLRSRRTPRQAVTSQLGS